MHDHIVSQIRHSGLHGDNTLHVIGVIQNTVRWHRRYGLFREWVKHMLCTKNVKLYVVEAVYKDRHPECMPENGEYEYLQVHTDSEIWLKENLINLGAKHMLPQDWKYMAWIDCDIKFDNHDWAQATMHQLQHYNILQPFSDVVDTDFYGSVCGHWKSFGYLRATGKPMWHGKGKHGYEYAHTGMGWACTRYWYENVNELLPICIVGAGDHHMAWGCLGKIRDTIHKSVCEDYFAYCDDWQRKAQYACAGLVGYAPGFVRHFHHGPKTQRGYWSRWSIIVDNDFNPKRDIAYDSQGVLQLVGTNKYAIEHAIMRYNRDRIEDSIEQY